MELRPVKGGRETAAEQPRHGAYDRRHRRESDRP